MSLRLHFLENVLDFSIWPNNERRPRHAHHLLAIHVLFLHHSEGLGNFLLGVSEEGEGQVLFFLKFLLRFWRVGRDAKQHGAGLLNLFI